MGLNETALNLMSDALASAVTHVSMHGAAAGANGANEVAGVARQPINYDPSTGGVSTDDGTAIDFTGAPANQAVAELGLWSALTGGTFYGSAAPTGDTACNAAGEYSIASSTITNADNS